MSESIDEPAPEEVPKSRRRQTLNARLAPEIQGADREALATWIKEQLAEVEREHQARIELLREGREHPCPAFERIVRNHGIVGTPKSTLAKLLGISDTTLKTHYGDAYEMAAAETMAKIASNMVRIATSTSDPAAAKVGMDMLARRGGEAWRPATKRLEVDNDPNKNNAPILDTSNMSAEDRQAIREIMERQLLQQSSDSDIVEE